MGAGGRGLKASPLTAKPSLPQPAPPVFHKTPASALLADASAWAMGEPVPQRTRDRLIDQVTGDPHESFLLLKALRQWGDSDTPILVERLLDERARRLKLEETRQKDIDEVALQAVTPLLVALLVGVTVGVLARTIAWPVGVLVLIVAVVAFAGMAVERLWIRTAQRALNQSREETESLARAIRDVVKALPQSG